MTTVSELLGNMDFMSFIYNLQSGGWFDYVFPFMLVYAIVYTILKNVEIFKGNNAVRVIIALIFALFAIAFPITDETYCGYGLQGQGVVSGCTVGTLMMTLFPGVTAFSMGLLALYIVVAMLGIDLVDFFGNDEDKNNYLRYILTALGLIVVVYYYARGFGWMGFDGSSEIGAFFSDPGLYILIIFGVFFWWVMKDDDNVNNENNKKKKDGNSE